MWLIFTIAVAATIAFLYNTKKKRGLPPGPLGLPIIGNLHQLGREPHLSLMKMKETYGDIFSINFGSYRAIVLSNYELVKEAFNDKACTGRPSFRPLVVRSGGNPIRGVIHSEGESWAEQRRFALKNLRDFGFGKKSMEVLVHEEIKELIQNLSLVVNKPIETINRFNAAVLNSLWYIITGNRFSHQDSRLNDLIQRLTSNTKESTNTGVTTYFPWLITLLPRLTGWQKIFDNFKLIMDLMKENIDDHISNHVENHCNDFIDVYLQQMKETTDKESSFFQNEGEHNLKIVIFDLFAAGTETTSTTLSWTMLLLALHPTVQENLFDEIKSVVGLSRLPSLNDRASMPYAEAVIMEVLRFSSIAPLGVFHKTNQRTSLGGYTIPKDTIVIANVFSIHRDPKNFCQPEEFNPDRFISVGISTDKKLIHNEKLIPFSLGKRSCIGQQLAKDELFLFTTSIFQRFRVEVDSNLPLPKLEYHTGTILVPKKHFLMLCDRSL